MYLSHVSILVALVAFAAATSPPTYGSYPSTDDAPAPITLPTSLNITTLATNDAKESTLECWQIIPLKVSNTPGIAGAVTGVLAPAGGEEGALGPIGTFVIPPEFDGGLHNAPIVQYVFFTSGLAVITLPNNSSTATIQGGRNGLILATDLMDFSEVGHTTQYPSVEVTNGLTLAVPGNVVPEHTVLYEGQCKGEELV